MVPPENFQYVHWSFSRASWNLISAPRLTRCKFRITRSDFSAVFFLIRCGSHIAELLMADVFWLSGKVFRDSVKFFDVAAVLFQQSLKPEILWTGNKSLSTGDRLAAGNDPLPVTVEPIPRRSSHALQVVTLTLLKRFGL